MTCAYREDLARAETSAAIKNGVLVRPEHCEECGACAKVDAHHDDYAKPLDIRWLCRGCHRRWHSKHGPGANRDRKAKAAHENGRGWRDRVNKEYQVRAEASMWIAAAGVALGLAHTGESLAKQLRHGRRAALRRVRWYRVHFRKCMRGTCAHGCDPGPKPQSRKLLIFAERLCRQLLRDNPPTNELWCPRCDTPLRNGKCNDCDVEGQLEQLLGLLSGPVGESAA